MENVIKEITDNANTYIETLEDVISDIKCSNCNAQECMTRVFCRVMVLENLKETLCQLND